MKEDGLVVRRYVLKLVNELKALENEVFEVTIGEKSCKVEFKVEGLPNDMKMLAFLAGELTNAAYYFCTFGDVNKDDADDYRKKFGPNGDWKPFLYRKRIENAIKVEKKKQSLAGKNVKAITLRNNITSFISKEYSRQEEIPLVRSYVDVAKCEPLHLKNNTVKEMFMKLVTAVLVNSEIPPSVKFFKELPEDCLFSFFVNYVRSSMNCNDLGKKLITWFSENRQGKGDKVFGFRFRGKESFQYLKSFPLLILNLRNKLQDQDGIYRVLCVFVQSLYLRKVVSFSVRIENISVAILEKMKDAARKLFVSCAKFDLKITPSLWVFSNAAPVHSKQLFQSLGLGLGTNSM